MGTFPPYDFAARKLHSLKRRFTRNPTIETKADYGIYDRLKEVPKKYVNEKTVIQKFIPEKSYNKYILREYHFLGDREYLNVKASEDPCFTTGEQIEFYPGSPPPGVIRLRRKLRMDYGKIDYIIHKGHPVIFDVNKTTGVSSNDSEIAGKFAIHLAPGILSINNLATQCTLWEILFCMKPFLLEGERRKSSNGGSRLLANYAQDSTRSNRIDGKT